MTESGSSAIEIEKVWGAVDGEEIVATRPSRQALLDELRNQGDDPSGYEIVAFPKNAGGGPF